MNYIDAHVHVWTDDRKSYPRAASERDYPQARFTPEDLFRRLRHDVKRPLLQVQDPLGRLRELHGVRDPLYRETAHDIVDTGRPTVAMLVNLIVMQLELAGIAVPPPDDPSP